MAGTVRASYDARVAWSSAVFGLIQLDRSTVGSADVLAATSWSQTFAGPYDNLGASGLRVNDIAITRGRSDDLSQMQAGTCSLAVIDYAGLLNPKNAGSPLYGLNLAGQTAIRPNRPGRIAMTYAGTTYPLFYGFVRTVEYDPGIRVGHAKIELIDLLSWLDTPHDDGTGSSPLPVVARMTNTTTGAAIAAILDYVGWTDASLRVLDVGDALPWFEATGDKTPLQLIAELVEANGGVFFIDASGRAVFEDRNTKWLRAAYASIANTMQAINPGVSIDNITNTWAATRQYEQANPISFIGADGAVQFQAVTLTDSTPQTATDPASRQEFGIRSNTIASKYWPDDTFALNHAQWRLIKTKDPDSPLWSLTIDNREDGQMRALAAAELERTITLSEARTGGTGSYFIEQIAHSISRADRSHKCTMILSERKASAGPFIVGTDTVGGAAPVGF